MAVYCPRRGDVVWLEFDPQAGHEQKGRRPAFVLSPEAYNAKTGLAIFCPVTTKTKGYPFEVPVPDGHKAKGVILSDHVKSFDWRARKASFCCRLPDEVFEDVSGKLGAILF